MPINAYLNKAKKIRWVYPPRSWRNPGLKASASARHRTQDLEKSDPKKNRSLVEILGLASYSPATCATCTLPSLHVTVFGHKRYTDSNGLGQTATAIAVERSLTLESAVAVHQKRQNKIWCNVRASHLSGGTSALEPRLGVLSG